MEEVYWTENEWIEGYNEGFEDGYNKCMDDIDSASNIRDFVPTPTSTFDADNNRRFLCKLLEVPYTTHPEKILWLLKESVYGMSYNELVVAEDGSGMDIISKNLYGVKEIE